MMTFLEYLESQNEEEKLNESPFTILRDIIRAAQAKDIVKALEHGVSINKIVNKIVDLPYKKKQRIRNNIRAYIKTDPDPKIIRKLEDIWHKTDDALLNPHAKI